MNLSTYNLKEYAIGWGQIIGIFSLVVWTIYAMIITAPFGLVVMGGLIWWGIQGTESALNGGKTDIESLFTYVQDDFKNNFGSGTWEHRMKLSNGNDEWAAMFPGKGHFIFTHICVPLIPLILWIVF